MDVQSLNQVKTPPVTGGVSSWVDQMYSACEALSVSDGDIISALSVTVPRDQGSGNLAKVELLTAGLAELYGLEVTVQPRERNITVRFALPGPHRNAPRV